MKITTPPPPTFVWTVRRRLPCRTHSLAVAEFVGDRWNLLVMDFDDENAKVVASRSIATADALVNFFEAHRIPPRSVAITAEPVSTLFDLALADGFSVFEVLGREESWLQGDELRYPYSEPEFLKKRFNLVSPACPDWRDESFFWQVSAPKTLDLVKGIKYRLPDASPRLKVGMVTLLDQAEMIDTGREAPRKTPAI
jgi:hypothetical protein